MKRIALLALSAAVLCCATDGARADTLTVLCSTGVKSVVEVLAPQFEKASGHKLNITYGASNLIVKDIDGGKAFDVVVVTPPLIKELIKSGKVVDGSAVNLAKAGVGLAVKSGTPKPDISTTEGLKKALLNAKAVAYTTAGQSGMHFMTVIDKLGIANEVKAKGKTLPGGAIGDFVVKGEADIAIQLVPELMAVHGLDVVGPFPPEVQSYIVLTAGVSSKASDKTAAEALIKFLSAPSALPLIKAKGLEPG
ncbi:MAG TPA: substrate-binding domain-containing protein [Pseudolabrys sp.]|nr:substrate-binding domain-containing protein [Pseudolabrys sp.]